MDALPTPPDYPTPSPFLDAPAPIAALRGRRGKKAPAAITLVVPAAPAAAPAAAAPAAPPAAPTAPPVAEGVAQAVSAAISAALAAQTELADKYHHAERRAEALDARVAALTAERDALAAELLARTELLDAAHRAHLADVEAAHAMALDAMARERDRLAEDLAETFARGEALLAEARQGAAEALALERSRAAEDLADERANGIATVAGSLSDVLIAALMGAIDDRMVAPMEAQSRLADRYAAATQRVAELENRVAILTSQLHAPNGPQSAGAPAFVPPMPPSRRRDDIVEADYEPMPGRWTLGRFFRYLFNLQGG